MSGHAPFEVVVDTEPVRGGWVTFTVIGSVVVVVAALLGVWISLPEPIKQARTIGQAPPMISGIHQTLINVEKPGLRLQREQADWLSRYHWVDRERGLVHIPIERAMDQIATGTK